MQQSGIIRLKKALVNPMVGQLRVILQLLKQSKVTFMRIQSQVVVTVWVMLLVNVPGVSQPESTNLTLNSKAETVREFLLPLSWGMDKIGSGQRQLLVEKQVQPLVQEQLFLLRVAVMVHLPSMAMFLLWRRFIQMGLSSFQRLMLMATQIILFARLVDLTQP